jgi:hypothetical protein
MAGEFQLSASSGKSVMLTPHLAISQSRLVFVALVLSVVGMGTVAIHAQTVSADAQSTNGSAEQAAGTSTDVL